MPTLSASAKVSRLLARLVDRPDAIAAVRALGGEGLRDLVARVGLEDAGELLALASHEQLVLAFDDDLFRADAPGGDEAFDAPRFLLWLEVLRESGDTFAAERLAALSEDFLALVVARAALVVDQDAVSGWLAEDTAAAERLDAWVEASPTEEIDRFLLVAKVHEGWDALVAVLVTMDQDHHERLARVLTRVAERSAAALFEPDEDEVDTLAEDMASERDERRNARGFVTPADARAFLTAAREGRGDPVERDPITRAVLRDHAYARGEPAPQPRAFVLPAARALTRSRGRTLRAELTRLLAEMPALYTERANEVAYLVNALVAGSALEGRPLRPVEAYELTVATIDLGLDLDPSSGLEDVPPDVLFRRGFRHLHVALVLPAAAAACAMLGAGAASAGAARALGEALGRGRPWLARASFLGAVSPVDRERAARLAALFDASPRAGGSWLSRAAEVARALAEATGAKATKVPQAHAGVTARAR